MLSSLKSFLKEVKLIRFYFSIFSKDSSVVKNYILVEVSEVLEKFKDIILGNMPLVFLLAISFSQ